MSCDIVIKPKVIVDWIGAVLDDCSCTSTTTTTTSAP